MDCAEEVNALRSELMRLPGVKELDFNLLQARMTVTHADGVVELQELIDAVARTGMQAQPWHGDRPARTEGGSLLARRGKLVMTCASGLLVLSGFLVHGSIEGWLTAMGGHDVLPPVAARVLYLLAAGTGAWYVLPKAVLALRRLRPEMNLLMVVAIVGAVGIGEYFEAATVAFLFALSLLLESWSVARVRRAVESLLALTPPQARILGPDGREETRDVADIAVGSRLLVRPGDRVPLDGKVVRGETTVNQAPITGESAPVPKTVDGEVFAGTINGDGAIEVLVTKPASDTTLARIIRMVSEAQGRRAASEQWVDRFARVYTPAVMSLAVVVAVIPPLAFGGAWSKWFYEALVLLVIACPCALVISTPVSIVAALTAAARNGVLIKGGAYVELPARLTAIALDKTGTLTEGRPAVCRVVALAGHTEQEVLAIAAAIEAHFEHPLGRAIVSHVRSMGIHVPPAESFLAMKGKGATAVLDGRPVWAGSHRFMEERGQEPPGVHEQLETLAASGASIVVIGNDEHVCGLIAMGDRVRPGAREVVADLRQAEIQRVVMLTGDNAETAAAVAMATGVDDVRAELLPEDKVAAIEELVERYEKVGMVGDGVNDAPAMARASLGIAMGAMGTDVAIETADIALMTDDLSRLPWLIRHSRRTLATIRQNIAASLSVKAVFVGLTFLGHASLWAAIIADMGVSLVVVFNALRLVRGRGDFGRKSI
jgi:Cd2+/Zn2+-exporting ATPase